MPCEPHRIPAPSEGVELGVRMGEVEHAALAEHDVEIELGAQAFPKLERELVKTRIRRQHVVGAHDRRVAPGVAAAEPALLEHGHIADAVLLGKVVGGREPMAPTSDDDDVVARLGCRIAPSARPVPVAGHRVARYLEDGVSGHTLPMQALRAFPHPPIAAQWVPPSPVNGRGDNKLSLARLRGRAAGRIDAGPMAVRPWEGEGIFAGSAHKGHRKFAASESKRSGLCAAPSMS